ncbi:MAG: O-antigen ligase family protein [Parcubacteria group bacterium]
MNRTVRALILIAAIIASASMIAVNFVDPIIVLVAVVGMVALALLIKYINIGFYLMVFFYPFVDWQFVAWNVNIPYVDFFALFVAVAFIIRTLLDWRSLKIKSVKEMAPGLGVAIIFWLACVLSIAGNTAMGPLWPQIKYLLRPLVFFYLMFVLLPDNLIKTDKILDIVLKILFWLGVLIGIDGLMSILLGAGPWYTHRATPYPIFGRNLLGGNQNAVAEVLVVAIPIAMILFSRCRHLKVRAWYAVSFIFMGLVLLMTFSRSGWLALLLQLIILFVVYYRHRLNRHTLFALLCVFVFIPLLLYFSLWQNIDWVRLSNSNRLLLTQVALYQFAQHPIIGSGLNSFQTLVGSTFVYWVEFGDPLDSHGFVQKLMVETGSIGTLAFVGLLAYLFYLYLNNYRAAKTRSAKNQILFFMLMFVGIVCFELFSTSYFVAKMWLPVGIGLVGSRLLRSG